MMVILFLRHALDHLLGLGIDRIQAHAWDLSEGISTGLQDLGHRVISPSQRSARSGNTCFLASDAAAVQKALAAQGVLVWGEYGRVRVSGHLYNDAADVERLLEVVDRIS